MKKVIMLVVAISAVVFTGCAKPDKVTKDGQEYAIWPQDNNSYSISAPAYTDNIERGVAKSYEAPMKRQLKLAAEITKQKGYSYFVILNAGMSNLDGFPINTYKELLRYVTLGPRHKTFQINGRNQGRGTIPFLDLTRVRLWFKPVGQEVANSYISVWSVEQTLRDTK